MLENRVDFLTTGETPDMADFVHEGYTDEFGVLFEW